MLMSVIICMVSQMNEIEDMILDISDATHLENTTWHTIIQNSRP